MRKIAFIPIVFILACIGCKNEKSNATLTEIQDIENGLLSVIQVKGDPKEFNIIDRMAYHKVPGVSIAIIENGKIKWAKGYGIANTNNGLKVDTNTIFQAGSISKPLAALSALKLVEKGKINLDQDVNDYLRDWRIPENKYTTDEKVTLRRLLTHTAGMTVHGFGGYQQTDAFPTITQVLNGKGNTPKIFVDTIPGSIWRYSGGGYTVMEKMVEDISGLPLEIYMANEILQPIGMKNSTYEQPLGAAHHSNASAAYDSEGNIIDGLWHNYPEQAAAGLWTTPSDLAKYCIEIQEILNGKENSILSKVTIEEMLTKHKNEWGLGPSLKWEKDSLIFQHSGKNAGFTNNLISFANRGNAVIIMTNSDNGGNLIGEILKSVSSYYNWGINNPKIVEIVELPIDHLEQFTGRYKLNFQVPEIGDYVIEVTMKESKLYIDDPNNENFTLTPMDEYNFINLERGDEVMFKIIEDRYELLWNNSFQFDKIEK